MTLSVNNQSLKDTVFPWLDFNGASIHLFMSWTLDHGSPIKGLFYRFSLQILKKEV